MAIERKYRANGSVRKVCHWHVAFSTRCKQMTTLKQQAEMSERMSKCSVPGCLQWNLVNIVIQKNMIYEKCACLVSALTAAQPTLAATFSPSLPSFSTVAVAFSTISYPRQQQSPLNTHHGRQGMSAAVPECEPALVVWQEPDAIPVRKPAETPVCRESDAQPLAEMWVHHLFSFFFLFLFNIFPFIWCLTHISVPEPFLEFPSPSSSPVLSWVLILPSGGGRNICLLGGFHHGLSWTLYVSFYAYK